MKQRNPYLLPVSLAIEAFVVLGIACVFMPAGWNMIPLLLIACVAVALAIKLRMLRAAPERPVAEDRTLEIDEDDLKVMDSAPQPTPQPTANLGRRINRAFGLLPPAYSSTSLILRHSVRSTGVPSPARRLVWILDGARHWD